MDKTYAREIKEIAHVASSKLREDRVAPRPEQSFESLESEMVPVDDRKLVMKKVWLSKYNNYCFHLLYF